MSQPPAGGPAMAPPAASPAPADQSMSVPPANFGSPPSGMIPILFNDHHVYSRPDRLKQGRVLAALVRGGTVLVPLRSLFEQTGATVSYDPGSKTVDVSKPGSDVKVTVGKPEVVINGESRPLDVPPEMYRGSILVPLRVISEGMGAYVQWVPDRHTVVVRYVQAAPPPPPVAPPVAPPVVPSASPLPTPAPEASPKEHGAQFFVAGDYTFNSKSYNEFSPGNKGGGDLAARVGAEFPLFGLAFMAEGNYDQYRYSHFGDARFDRNGNTGANGNFDGLGAPVCTIAEPIGAGGNQGCVTTIGGVGQSFVPSFDARDTTIDGRVGIGIPFPRIFIVGSYAKRFDNYGYPSQQGFGAGIEKLPDFDNVISPYGSFVYYPSLAAGKTFAYRSYTYRGGLTISFAKFTGIPLFGDVGYKGDHGINKFNAPSNYSNHEFSGGLGLHF